MILPAALMGGESSAGTISVVGETRTCPRDTRPCRLPFADGASAYTRCEANIANRRCGTRPATAGSVCFLQR